MAYAASGTASSDGVGLAGGNQRGCGVQQHNIAAAGAFAIENRANDRCILLASPPAISSSVARFNPKSSGATSYVCTWPFANFGDLAGRR